MTQIEKAPFPLIFVAIEPKLESERQRLAESLVRLASEDASIRVDTDRDTDQTLLSANSEDQIVGIVDRLLHDFKVDTNVGRPQVAYKETIRRAVEQECKFVRRRGEDGQYAHVIIRLEPVAAGGGWEFENSIEGGLIPHEYIPALEEGIREASNGGVLAGYPLIDFKVTLLGGSYHEVDSSGLAFRIAGAMACKEAARKASPVLLEPMMAVEVVVPDELIGEVIGDLSVRRGEVHGVEARDGAQVITANVPLKGMLGYTTAVRTIAQGRATYAMQFLAYVEASGPPDPDGNEPVSLAMRVA